MNLVFEDNMVDEENEEKLGSISRIDVNNS